MYKAVIFDAGSTLIDATLNREERFLHCARQWGLQADPEAVQAAHHRLWQEHFGRGFRDMNLAEATATWQAFYHDLLAALNLPDPGDVTALRLAEACSWLRWMYVHEEAPVVLGQLQARFRLGLLSNAPPELRGLMQDLGLARYFQSMVISGEVGVRKPDPAIYAIALQSLGVSAGEALFVDDRVENLAAARDLGMGTLLIDFTDTQAGVDFTRVEDLYGVLRVVGDA